MTSTRGLGLAGEAPRETILAAAPAAERAGYDTFWLSQPREGSTLAILGQVADATSHIRLGVGAIPFGDNAPEDIATQVETLGPPIDRLRLGVGSGTGIGAMERLRQGVAQLRERVGAEIVVAPLGPKMCALAGELADTVLLNWLTPEYATVSKAWIAEGAERAGRATPVVATYVRCALGEGATDRLAAECARYSGFPHYAAHFARQGVAPRDTTIHAMTATELQERLGAYGAVLDHVVVRAITPGHAIPDVLELVEAARPRG